MAASLLTACHQKTAPAVAPADTLVTPADTLAFDSVVVRRQVPLYKDRENPYYEVDIKLLYARGDAPAARRVNDSLMAARLFDVIEDHSPVMPTIQATVDTFAARYERAWHKDIRDAEYHPDSVPEFLNYTFSLRTWTEPAGPGRLAYCAFTEIYQGGAHGTYVMNVMNFDTRTGQLLSMDDIFKPGYERPLLRLIMKHMAQDMELKDDSLSTLREAGFFYDMEPVLPQVFQLRQDSIFFTYNVYDIAPYALGAIEVDLSKAQMRDLLK